MWQHVVLCRSSVARSALVVTIYATCYVISHVECCVLLHYYFPQCVDSAQYGCFLQFLDVFPNTPIGYFLNDFEKVSVESIINVITFFFCDLQTLYLYCKVFIYNDLVGLFLNHIFVS